MDRGKTDVCKAIFSAGLDRLECRWAASSSVGGPSAPQRLPPSRGLRSGAQHLSFAARAVLVAGLLVTGSTAALADNGGRGHPGGVASPNLGVSELHRAGAGVGAFAPSAVPGAAWLTPSDALPPPGHLSAPGSRLGRGHSAGSPPGLTGTNGVLPPRNDVEMPRPGNGFALGNGGATLAPGAMGASRVPQAETARTPSATHARGNEQPGGGEALPRRIPTCR